MHLVRGCSCFNSFSLAKAASASLVRPRTLRATPLLYQVSTRLGSSLSASSKALMDSSYLPWLNRATPLLLQALAYLGSSLVIESYSFIEPIFSADFVL